MFPEEAVLKKEFVLTLWNTALNSAVKSIGKPAGGDEIARYFSTNCFLTSHMEKDEIRLMFVGTRTVLDVLIELGDMHSSDIPGLEDIYLRLTTRRFLIVRQDRPN